MYVRFKPQRRTMYIACQHDSLLLVIKHRSIRRIVFKTAFRGSVQENRHNLIPIIIKPKKRSPRNRTQLHPIQQQQPQQ